MFFTNRQTEYLSDMDHRYCFSSGATRSGKSYLGRFLIAMRLRAIVGKPGLRVILGTTKSTIDRNVIIPLTETFGSDLVKPINSQNIATIFNEPVYCLGASKTSHTDILRGSSIAYCFADEIGTYHPDVWEMLKSRLDKEYSCLDANLNPYSPNHFLYDFIFNTPKDVDLAVTHYTIYDNPFLPKDVVRNLEAEYRGSVYFKRFILGEWTKAEGLVFDTFTDSHIFTDDVVKDKYFKRYVIGVDVGTKHAQTYLLAGVDINNRIYILKEYYYNGEKEEKQKTNSEYAKDLADFAKDYHVERIVVDSAAQSFITECKKNSFPVCNAKKDVLEGIRIVNNLFGNDNLFISSKCVNLIRELNSYCWDNKASEDKVIKENDDCVDNLRYVCMYLANRHISTQF